jgi:hypothetical protein
MGNIDKINKIDNKLQLIGEVIKSAKSNGGFTSIDLDFTLAKVIDMYEDLIKIKSENKPIKPKAVEQKVQKPIVEQEPKTVEKIVEKIVYVEKPVEKIVEVKVEANQEPIVPKKTVESPKVETPVVELPEVEKPKPTPIKKVETPKTKVVNKPVQLKIAINERFEFIRELFNNSKANYDECISTVKTIGSYNEAKNYLKENYSFDYNNDITLNFLEKIKSAY